MKAFYYMWCVMAVIALVASFFNTGHIFFSLIPSLLMASASYPEKKEER